MGNCAECSETQTEEYSDRAAEKDGAREGSEEEAVETAASLQGQETLEQLTGYYASIVTAIGFLTAL